MSKYCHAFYVRPERLSDGSEVFEVRAQNTDQRLGSAATHDEAARFVFELNRVCTDFVNSTVHNSIDV